MTQWTVSGYARVYVYHFVEAETAAEAIAEAHELGVSYFNRDDATLELDGELAVEEDSE